MSDLKKPKNCSIKHVCSKLQSLLLKIINKIKNSQVIPKQWAMMLITTIYKSKGSRKDLVNQRGIFLTQVICKIWERLIKDRASFATCNINKLQAGSTKNKSTADHTFIIRSCITRAVYLKCSLFLNFYDFRQCFDKLWLEDSVISLYKLGLQNEFLSLIYKTNLEANIVVKTPFGNSASFTKTSIVKQGSVTACCLCSATTGEFCDENTEGGMSIGDVIIRNLAYVDDVMLANSNVTDANSSHNKFCFFADKKKQPLNEDKCFLLPVNCRPTDAVPVQVVNDKLVKIKEMVTYLGDIFNQKGNYKDMIEDRVRKATVCTINAMALCSDQEMGRYAIESLLLLYAMVFIPGILYNSETWNNLSKNDISRLQSSQNKYLKWMLHTPRGTSTAFTLLELGILPINREIELRKLNWLHHILTLPDDDPVLQVYIGQKKLVAEPNWFNEITGLLREHNINFNEDDIKNMSKGRWKNVTKSAVHETTLRALNLECKNQSKTAGAPAYHKLLKQQYFTQLSPSKARTLFQIRAGVFDIKSNRPYQYDDQTCRVCELENETLDHIVNECTQPDRVPILTSDVYSICEEERTEMLSRIEQFKELLQRKD